MAYQISGVSVIDDNKNASLSGTITFNDGSIQSSLYTLIPKNSVVTFHQAAAPTGWTQVTTHNNKALRIVSGTGGGSGGNTAFTSVFTSRTPAGSVTMSNAAFTLTTNEIPSHNHYANLGNGGSYSNSNVNGPAFQNQSDPNSPLYVAAAGGGASHTHANTASFSGTALDFAVQYIDMIIASKN